MKRFLIILLTLALMVGLSPIRASAPVQTDIALSVGTDETERNLVWYALSSAPGSVRLWADGNTTKPATIYPSTVSKASDGDYYIHKVILQDLLPGTDYVYRLVNGDATSPLYSFTTSSLGDFSFAFAGDPQLGESKNTEKDRAGWALTLDRITNHAIFDDTAFLLTAGDHVDEKNNEDHFDDLLHHEALTGLPMANVIGNHEAKSEIFSQHFYRPNESGEYGVTAAGGDAYFTYNDVLFFLINSNDKDTAEHRAFMEAVLADNPDHTWKIVALHHSLYTVANHAYDDSILERREELVPLFDELGIDVVLSGHDHVYCRSYLMDGLTPLSHMDYYDRSSMHSATNAEGVLYITANSSSGSKTYDPKNDSFPYSAEHHQYNVGEISRVDVSENSFSIRTYRTDTMEEVDHFTLYKEAIDAHPFTDVPMDAWYESAVQYSYTHGLMNGTGNDLFSPDLPTTRAMAVTLLYRLDGEPDGGNHSFTDIPRDAYYSDAVAWAAEAGIVEGVSAELFAPNRPITREQLVTILARYAGYSGQDITAEPLIDAFSDGNMVASYALNAMNWALRSGLIRGTSEDRLSPRGTATRAQVAQIIMRLDKITG